MSCNDRRVDVNQLLPGHPDGPVKSVLDGFQITINFLGGAALNKILLPTHDNIMSVKILILLTGETNHIPYMGGQVLECLLIKSQACFCCCFLNVTSHALFYTSIHLNFDVIFLRTALKDFFFHISRIILRKPKISAMTV